MLREFTAACRYEFNVRLDVSDYLLKMLNLGCSPSSCYHRRKGILREQGHSFSNVIARSSKGSQRKPRSSEVTYLLRSSDGYLYRSVGVLQGRSPDFEPVWISKEIFASRTFSFDFFQSQRGSDSFGLNYY